MKNAAVIVEEVEVWRKSLAFTPEEARLLKALTTALGAKDHKVLALAFVDYLRGATK